MVLEQLQGPGGPETTYNQQAYLDLMGEGAWRVGQRAVTESKRGTSLR